MGPKNVIVGDSTNPTDIPQTQVPQQDLTRERNMAKFSQTAEFKALKSVIEAKIDHYQSYLPGNGSALSILDIPNEERGWRWLAADVVITEFQSIISAYEQAAEAVKNESNDRPPTA